MSWTDILWLALAGAAAAAERSVISVETSPGTFREIDPTDFIVDRTAYVGRMIRITNCYVSQVSTSSLVCSFFYGDDLLDGFIIRNQDAGRENILRAVQRICQRSTGRSRQGCIITIKGRIDEAKPNHLIDVEITWPPAP